MNHFALYNVWCDREIASSRKLCIDIDHGGIRAGSPRFLSNCDTRANNYLHKDLPLGSRHGAKDAVLSIGEDDFFGAVSGSFGAISGPFGAGS